MANRLIGRLPKVGIRPVIDGRERGIRESLEEQTMNMARASAQLIEANLRFPSGERVECVISETTIGGIADAARCADQFEREGVAVSLTVTPCWCYGAEVMDMKEASEYVNSKWGNQDPFKGDVVNSYNDGPVEDGSIMGPFYEIESSSSAAYLSSGQKIIHTQRIFHITSNEKKLSLITEKIFNLSITEIREAFEKN